MDVLYYARDLLLSHDNNRRRLLKQRKRFVLVLLLGDSAGKMSASGISERISAESADDDCHVDTNQNLQMSK